jgi:predicted DNA-binding transcriptional regulator AlpA
VRVGGEPRIVRDGDCDLRPGEPVVSLLFFLVSRHITVLLAASYLLPTAGGMTFADPEASSGGESGDARPGRPGADRLISIGDIRVLFKLGRAAAYELTRRPGFPAPVRVSARCLRWWASEVDAYADALQREGAARGIRRTRRHQPAQQKRSLSPGTPGRTVPTQRARRDFVRARWWQRQTGRQ